MTLWKPDLASTENNVMRYKNNLMIKSILECKMTSVIWL